MVCVRRRELGFVAIRALLASFEGGENTAGAALSCAKRRASDGFVN